MVICSFNLCGQKTYKLNYLAADKLPKGIKYEGDIFNDVVMWNDSFGKNIVITSESGVYESKDSTLEFRERNSDIFAYHYIIRNNKIYQNWRLIDFVKNCQFDIIAKFIEKAFQVTDLNQNGIPEIWIMYKMNCTSDVSPSEMKLIMYEGKKKFAIRGQNKVQLGIDENGQNEYIGGEYKIDNAFKYGPTYFLKFAIKLWDRNVIENYED